MDRGGLGQNIRLNGLATARSARLVSQQVHHAAQESVPGTFEKCRLTLKMSAFWGLSEVPFQGRQDRL